MSIKELQAGTDYENLLKQAYKNVSLKEVIPKQQEDILNLDDRLRLQQNLTRSNLSTIIQGQPILINEILQYISDTDGDYIQFNKYFTTFKNAIGSFKIRKLDDFAKIWNTFKTQQLGQQLVQLPEITITGLNNTIPELEKLSSEEIDALFRKAIIKKEGKPVEEVNKIQYPTKSGTLSSSLMLKNKGGIIEFDPVPTDNTIKDKQTKINNVKIRYIYRADNPSISMRGLNVKWQKPEATTTETSMSTTIAVPIKSVSGSGLDAHLALKKKSVHSKYR